MFDDTKEPIYRNCEHGQSNSPPLRKHRGVCLRLLHVTFWCFVEPASLTLGGSLFSLYAIFYFVFLPQLVNFFPFFFWQSCGKQLDFAVALRICCLCLLVPGGKCDKSQAPPLHKHRGVLRAGTYHTLPLSSSFLQVALAPEGGGSA